MSSKSKPKALGSCATVSPTSSGEARVSDVCLPSSSRLSVRNYHPSDLDSVISIFLRAIREIACNDYSPAQINAWAQVDRAAWAKRRLSRPTWVAVLKQELVGFADLEPDGHLDMMFVHPAHQGVGVATLLLMTVETSASRQRLSRIFTEASITARPFFERRGFSVVARQEVSKRGQRLTNFRMEKHLAKDPLHDRHKHAQA
ncbi:MAG: GNAT family N-acetyltransferase [Hyphomicrobiales bacterium]|nr:GNAT family N-acetyltransferase [Hyphomicrobiales bacterium]MBV9741942.1 GNAT family N-acetyltransferase [Hyphomicrobiales bacterium]